MSAMEDLTAALKENTAAMLASNALRETAIGAVKEAAAAAPAAKATAAKAAKDEQKAAATAETTKAAAAQTGDLDEEKLTTIRNKIAAYVGGADRANEEWAQAERAARKTKVKTLLQHEKVKVPGTPADKFDASNVSSVGYATFIASIDALTAKGDVTPEPNPTETASSSALDL